MGSSLAAPYFQEVEARAGRPVTEDERRLLRKNVLEELIRERLWVADSKRRGFVATEADVDARLQRNDYFKTNGKFDPVKFKQFKFSAGIELPRDSGSGAKRGAAGQVRGVDEDPVRRSGDPAPEGIPEPDRPGLAPLSLAHPGRDLARDPGGRRADPRLLRRPSRRRFAPRGGSDHLRPRAGRDPSRRVRLAPRRRRGEGGLQREGGDRGTPGGANPRKKWLSRSVGSRTRGASTSATRSGGSPGDPTRWGRRSGRRRPKQWLPEPVRIGPYLLAVRLEEHRGPATRPFRDAVGIAKHHADALVREAEIDSLARLDYAARPERYRVARLHAEILARATDSSSRTRAPSRSGTCSGRSSASARSRGLPGHDAGLGGLAGEDASRSGPEGATARPRVSNHGRGRWRRFGAESGRRRWPAGTGAALEQVSIYQGQPPAEPSLLEGALLDSLYKTPPGTVAGPRVLRDSVFVTRVTELDGRLPCRLTPRSVPRRTPKWRSDGDRRPIAAAQGLLREPQGSLPHAAALALRLPSSSTR